MEDEVYKAIAKLMLSTKKKSNRLLSITEISREINWLSTKLGGIKNVSKELKITTGMINQFLSVEKLDEKVQQLVEERKIDSVSVAFYLTRFHKNDQLILANKIISGEIHSHELRALSPLRKQYPNLTIDDLVDKLLSSKNIKISVIKFYLEDLKRDKIYFTNELANITGADNIFSIDFESTPCSLKLTKAGEYKLREYARESNISLEKLINQLLN